MNISKIRELVQSERDQPLFTGKSIANRKSQAFFILSEANFACGRARQALTIKGVTPARAGITEWDFKLFDLKTVFFLPVGAEFLFTIVC